MSHHEPRISLWEVLLASLTALVVTAALLLNCFPGRPSGVPYVDTGRELNEIRSLLLDIEVLCESENIEMFTLPVYLCGQSLRVDVQRLRVEMAALDVALWPENEGFHLFTDPWGNLVCIRVEEVPEDVGNDDDARVPVSLTGWSKGPNGRDERGEGDDLRYTNHEVRLLPRQLVLHRPPEPPNKERE